MIVEEKDLEDNEIIPISKEQFVEEYEKCVDEEKNKPVIEVDIGTHSCNICS